MKNEKLYKLSGDSCDEVGLVMHRLSVGDTRIAFFVSLGGGGCVVGGAECG